MPWKESSARPQQTYALSGESSRILHLAGSFPAVGEAFRAHI